MKFSVKHDDTKTLTLDHGDHFNLILADGTMLNVEQTADDFSIVHQDGIVAYTAPTSDHAKEHDADLPRRTGRK